MKNKKQDRVRIRKVRDVEWPAVFEIYEQGFGSAGDRLKDSACVVARMNKKVVGFALLDIKDKEVYISNVGVHEEFRGRGICTKMLKKLTKMLPDFDRKKLTLMVARDNESAVRCYRSVGFRPVKEDASGGFLSSMMDMEFKSKWRRKGRKCSKDRCNN